MIDLQEAKSYLTDWVINFLDIPQRVLNDIAPCPYAKSAIVNGKVDFEIGRAHV